MSVVSQSTPATPLLDERGNVRREWIKWFQGIGQTVNAGFDAQDNYQGPIGAKATIVGRQFLATIVQHLTDAGLIEPAGLPAATSTEQGAVIMGPGAVNNHLGTAAQQATTAFDPAGAAATAQSNAQVFATAAANTAQSNAETFASDASNLSSGTVAAARLPGITVTIVTAALTGGGTQGSQTFTNGVLTAQVPAT